MKLFMYNTATNWCKLFLSSKQEFYYPVRVSSEFFFLGSLIADENISQRGDVE